MNDAIDSRFQKRLSPAIRSILATVATVVILAGCGGDDSSSSASGSGTGTSTGGSPGGSTGGSGSGGTGSGGGSGGGGSGGGGSGGGGSGGGSGPGTGSSSAAPPVIFLADKDTFDITELYMVTPNGPVKLN